MNAAVFLDRDNTLIHNDGDLGDPAKVVLMQGVATAVASLRGLGFRIVVVTNQGGVARGKYAEQDVERVHERISELVRQGANGATIDRFYFCPFHPEATVKKYKKEHSNRKPQPGMLLEAAQELSLDLSHSWMIGDQMRDIQAGAAAGCRTILLREDADQLAPLDLDRYAGVQVLSNTSGGRVRSTAAGDAEGAGGAESDADEQERGGRAVKPDYIARSLVEAVRIVAQQRNKRGETTSGMGGASGGASGDNSGGGGGSGEGGRPVRKWDAAAVARLQRASKKPASAADPSDGATAAQPPSARPAGKPPRPFRPWSAPPPPPPEDVPVEGSRQETASVEVTPAQAWAAMVETDAASASGQTNATAGDESAPRNEAVESILEERGNPRVTNALLRQMLQELRTQRSAGQEFSYRSIVALVLQFAAAVCLLAALMMGGESPMLFAKLATTAVLAGLLAIGTLLTGR